MRFGPAVAQRFSLGYGPRFVNKNTQWVRLLAAVAVSLVACCFVAYYSRLSRLRFNYEHPGSHLMHATDFLSQWAWIGYALPTVAFLVGVWALRRSAVSTVLLEVIIAGTWFLSLVWFGFCLLMWQAQNVPAFSHMELHF